MRRADSQDDASHVNMAIGARSIIHTNSPPPPPPPPLYPLNDVTPTSTLMCDPYLSSKKPL